MVHFWGLLKRNKWQQKGQHSLLDSDDAAPWILLHLDTLSKQINLYILCFPLLSSYRGAVQTRVRTVDTHTTSDPRHSNLSCFLT